MSESPPDHSNSADIRQQIAEAMAEAAFTGQFPVLEDETTGAVDRARLLTDFVLDRWESAVASDEERTDG